eukprot:3531160-Amphidinium_carterae.1
MKWQDIQVVATCHSNSMLTKYSLTVKDYLLSGCLGRRQFPKAISIWLTISSDMPCNMHGAQKSLSSAI